MKPIDRPACRTPVSTGIRRVALRSGCALLGAWMAGAPACAQADGSPPASAAAASASTRAADASDAIEVLGAEFGSFADIAAPVPVLTPTRVVAMAPGQSYGWAIAVRTNRQQLRWREELTLPTPPLSWDFAPDPADVRLPTLSDDRKTLTTERLARVRGGTISHWWTMSPGDPKGAYALRIFIEDQPAASFVFEVR